MRFETRSQPRHTQHSFCVVAAVFRTYHSQHATIYTLTTILTHLATSGTSLFLQHPSRSKICPLGRKSALITRNSKCIATTGGHLGGYVHTNWPENKMCIDQRAVNNPTQHLNPACWGHISSVLWFAVWNPIISDHESCLLAW